MLGRPAHVRDERDERVEVVGDDGHRRRIGGPVVAHDRLQATARVGDRAGVDEDLPPARLELAVVTLGQLARDVPERVAVMPTTRTRSAG